MKKILAPLAVLFCSVAVAVQTDVAHAANIGFIDVNGVGTMTSLSPLVLYGEVGDRFVVRNNITGAMAPVVDVGTGPGDTGGVSAGQPPQQQACSPLGQQATCNVPPSGFNIYTVTQLGTISVKEGSNSVLSFEVIAPPAVVYIPFFTASLDPNGGSCTIGGEARTTQFTVSGFAVRFPNSDVCRRRGYELYSWQSATGDSLPDDLVVANGTFRAVWRRTAQPAPPGVATALVNYLCGPCSSVALWWEPSATPGATYEVVVKTGNSSVVNTVSSAPAPGSSSPFMLRDLVPGQSYTVEIFAVLEGASSETGARFGSDRASSFTLSAVPRIAIDISGERGTVAGKSGVIVNGLASGFVPGDTVVPYVRFPGQEYVQGSARPVIQADGSFEWQRKTGKKTYVYFTSADGTVTSNRIIIAAQ